MFTGIVQERGRVASFDGGRLVIESQIEAGIGDSVAVDGVCLTVADSENGTLVFDVMVETLERAKLFGAEVNLEPALRAGDPLGGHYVQGHVDGVGTVRSVELEGDGKRVWIDAEPELMRYLVEKGSITVEGVSLTVAGLAEDGFAVALVQHTLAATTLGALAPGDKVNLETDVLAKYVERLLPGLRIFGMKVEEKSAVRHHRGGDRGHPSGQVRGRRRRGRPRERGRPDDRGPVRHARGRELHDEGGARADLPLPHGRSLRRARPSSDDGAKRDAVRHGLHRLGRGARRRDHGDLRAGSLAHDSGRRRSRGEAGRSRAARPRLPASRAREGGVLARAGQTEAAVDLARLAGLIPAGVVCEIMNEDGTMARVPDLIPYCERHGLKLITTAALIEYRRRHERLVERMTTVAMPTMYGDFTAVAFRETLTGKHHVALVKGDVEGAENVLVRVHSECLTGDVFHSLRCDCGEQLEQALERIAAEERGVLLYMAQEGRGIGLLNKLRAYELQENGYDTVEANLELGFQPDMRDYGIGNQILAELGLTTIRILTNNPKKITGIEGFGLEVVEQVPIETTPNAQNARYLATKRDKLGHKLHHQDLKYEPLEGE